AHRYARNVIRGGRKTREKIDVLSCELLTYLRLVDPDATTGAELSDARLPDYFLTAGDVPPSRHVDIQAAAQKWIDSSISKTVNVPTQHPFDRFQDIYLYACEK